MNIFNINTNTKTIRHDTIYRLRTMKPNKKKVNPTQNNLNKIINTCQTPRPSYLNFSFHRANKNPTYYQYSSNTWSLVTLNHKTTHIFPSPQFHILLTPLKQEKLRFQCMNCLIPMRSILNKISTTSSTKFRTTPIQI